jgi:hypothetical protein
MRTRLPPSPLKLPALTRAPPDVLETAAEAKRMLDRAAEIARRKQDAEAPMREFVSGSQQQHATSNVVRVRAMCT